MEHWTLNRCKSAVSIEQDHGYDSPQPGNNLGSKACLTLPDTMLFLPVYAYNSRLICSRVLTQNLWSGR